MLSPYYREMAEKYNRLTAAHNYLVGFTRHGKLYYVRMDFSELMGLLREDRESTSKGGRKKLRVYVPTSTGVTWIMEGRALEIGLESELKADSHHNRGQNFERIVTEKLAHETWTADNVSFDLDGDVTLDGIKVQVKLSTAELTNERVLDNAEERAKARG